jgi:ABC-type branched-subunit amino acid transport system substrate-binding protein
MHTLQHRPFWLRSLFTIALALAACAMLAACGGGGSKSTSSTAATSSAGKAATGTPIKLGVMADLNGTCAPIGASIRLGTDLAVQQLNANGGVNGHPVQVQYADPQSDPSQAVQLATQLVQQEHVDVLDGSCLSSECRCGEGIAMKLQTVYITSSGCAAEDVTAKSCNKYTFRMEPVGAQVIGPLADYMVKTYGKRWAVLYSDYAFGQSQLAAYKAVLQKSGGTVPIEIPIPNNEANVAPYITKVPTDGSVDGLVVAGLGAGDQARVVGALAQFGVSKKLPIVGAATKETFGGVYPDTVNGSIGESQFLSNQPEGNKFAPAFEQDFKGMGSKDGDALNIIGGAKAVPGSQGYIAYAAMSALKEGMIASKFSGRADNEKLISALETLKAPLGADFPGGDFIMNKSDHQGAMTTYIYKIDGQNEPVLSTVPADKIPPVGSCHV